MWQDGAAEGQVPLHHCGPHHPSCKFLMYFVAVNILYIISLFMVQNI